MKRFITILLFMGVCVLSVWSYNSNINNNKITSYRNNDPIYYILSERIKEKNQYKMFKLLEAEKKKNNIINNNIIVKENTNTPIYNIPLSEDLQTYIYKLSKEKDIPHELVLGVIKTESNFNPRAKNINKNGSIDRGIMQINSCHEDLCKQLEVTDLYNPYQNVKVGVELLSNIYKQYPNIHKAMMVYNMGLNGAKRNWKVGRGSTTYSRKVVNNINIIISSK